jgi:poly(A) polymerase
MNNDVHKISLPPENVALLKAFRDVSGAAWMSGPVVARFASSKIVAATNEGKLWIPKWEVSWERKIQKLCPDLIFESDDSGCYLIVRGSGADFPQRLSLSIRPQLSHCEDVEALLCSFLRDHEITIYGMLIDVEGSVLDPFGGWAHLKSGTIRTIVNPSDIFRVDPSMMLRVAVHIARLGFSPDAEMSRFGQRDAANLLSAARSSWVEGINDVLLSPHVDEGLMWLQRVKALNYLLPEVSSLVRFHEECEVHHKDCWDHTLKVIKKANRDLCTRWAALCHDVGKVWTRSVDRKGRVHFYRHEEFGAILFEGIAARFRLDHELSHRVEAVIRLHGRVNLYEPEWSDSAIRRLIRDVGPHLEDLIRFSRADFTSKRQSKIEQIRRQLDELERRVAEIIELDRREPHLPKGLGNLLMSELKLEPGPILGDLRKGLECLCDRDLLESGQDGSFYVDAIRSLGIDQLLEAVSSGSFDGLSVPTSRVG